MDIRANKGKHIYSQFLDVIIPANKKCATFKFPLPSSFCKLIDQFGNKNCFKLKCSPAWERNMYVGLRKREKNGDIVKNTPMKDTEDSASDIIHLHDYDGPEEDDGIVNAAANVPFRCEFQSPLVFSEDETFLYLANQDSLYVGVESRSRLDKGVNTSVCVIPQYRARKELVLAGYTEDGKPVMQTQVIHSYNLAYTIIQRTMDAYKNRFNLTASRKPCEVSEVEHDGSPAFVVFANGFKQFTESILKQREELVRRIQSSYEVHVVVFRVSDLHETVEVKQRIEFCMEPITPDVFFGDGKGNSPVLLSALQVMQTLMGQMQIAEQAQPAEKAENVEEVDAESYYGKEHVVAVEDAVTQEEVEDGAAAEPVLSTLDVLEPDKTGEMPADEESIREKHENFSFSDLYSAKETPVLSLPAPIISKDVLSGTESSSSAKRINGRKRIILRRSRREEAESDEESAFEWEEARFGDVEAHHTKNKIPSHA